MPREAVMLDRRCFLKCSTHKLYGVTGQTVTIEHTGLVNVRLRDPLKELYKCALVLMISHKLMWNHCSTKCNVLSM